MLIWVSCAGSWSVHIGNTQWHFRAQDTAAQPCALVLLYEWVSVQHCHGNSGADWHSGWAPSAQLWSCSCLSRAALPGTGSIPGRCQSRAGTHSTQESLTTNTFSLLLVYQTELGMQINWCKCKINSINSCKIKAWLFSEILPGSQVHWATVTLSPLKIFKVVRQVFCHYYSLMRLGHSSVHRKCTLIVLSVLKNYTLNLIFVYLIT